MGNRHPPSLTQFMPALSPRFAPRLPPCYWPPDRRRPAACGPPTPRRRLHGVSPTEAYWEVGGDEPRGLPSGPVGRGRRPLNRRFRATSADAPPLGGRCGTNRRDRAGDLTASPRPSVRATVLGASFLGSCSCPGRRTGCAERRIDGPPACRGTSLASPTEGAGIGSSGPRGPHDVRSGSYRCWFYLPRGGATCSS